MVDQPMSLDRQRIALGHEVLAKADQIGLDVSCAGWVRDADSNNWVLELATRLIDVRGPAWIYRRLVPLISAIAQPSNIDLLRIRLSSPHETMWRAVSSGMSIEDSEIALIGNMVNGIHLPDMILYRARRTSPMEKSTGEHLDRSYQDLVAG